MLLNAQHAQLNLADDEVARLTDACDSRLEVTHGFVWVTVDGDRNDVVLGAGESLPDRFPRRRHRQRHPRRRLAEGARQRRRHAVPPRPPPARGASRTACSSCWPASR